MAFRPFSTALAAAGILALVGLATPSAFAAQPGELPIPGMPTGEYCDSFLNQGLSLPGGDLDSPDTVTVPVPNLPDHVAVDFPDDAELEVPIDLPDDTAVPLPAEPEPVPPDTLPEEIPVNVPDDTSVPVPVDLPDDTTVPLPPEPEDVVVDTPNVVTVPDVDGDASYNVWFCKGSARRGDCRTPSLQLDAETRACAS